MTEVRTTSSTGGQKGVKPERLSLLPRKALEAMARVYAFGATKYAAHNWRRRYEWDKSIDSAMRHMLAFADGETNDPESGLPHPAHAMFHMAALLTWLEEDGEGPDNPMDTRWPADLDRAKMETAMAEYAEKTTYAGTWVTEYDKEHPKRDVLAETLDRMIIAGSIQIGEHPSAEIFKSGGAIGPLDSRHHINGVQNSFEPPVEDLRF